MFTEDRIPVGDLRLNMASGPHNGPPLWLLHGLVRRWQDFGPILPELAARWTVRAHDHRGHGRSDRAASYLVTDYLADATALVRAENDPPVLVGHSLGALVALGVAAVHPERVRAVVLLDPPGMGFLAHIDRTPYAATWAGMQGIAGQELQVGEIAARLGRVRVPSTTHPGQTIEYGSTRDAAALRFVARCLRDLDPAVFTPALEKRWDAGFDPYRPGALRCPALFVVADPVCGGMLPESADVDLIQSALADGVRVNLRGVGHLPHTQDPVGTLKLLHAFLDSL